MQNTIKEVEILANKWGFRLSVEKTKVICFSKKEENPIYQIKVI